MTFSLGSRANGVTTITFKRPLAASDSKLDREIRLSTLSIFLCAQLYKTNLNIQY
jgi:hypothetical protein